jgi:indolepyruvate decarboxylase
VSLRDFVEALLEHYGPVRPSSAPVVEARSPVNSEGDVPITFERFFASVQSFLDDTMIVIPDESSSMYMASALPIAIKGGFASQAAWGAIGYAVAAALGVAIGSGKRPVVFVGDGGLQMMAPALSTLQREETGAIVFVMDNGIYGIEQALVDLSPFTSRSPFKPYNVLPRWDYLKLTEALGGRAVTVETMATLEDLLPVLKRERLPLWVVCVNIPSRDLPPPVARLASDTGFPRNKY